jgi:hypothetical protein
MVEEPEETREWPDYQKAHGPARAGQLVTCLIFLFNG